MRTQLVMAWVLVAAGMAWGQTTQPVAGGRGIIATLKAEETPKDKGEWSTRATGVATILKDRLRDYPIQISGKVIASMTSGGIGHVGINEPRFQIGDVPVLFTFDVAGKSVNAGAYRKGDNAEAVGVITRIAFTVGQSVLVANTRIECQSLTRR